MNIDSNDKPDPETTGTTSNVVDLDPYPETFTYHELRITLTAFAMWLFKGGPNEGREVELADQFIEQL